MSPGLRLLAASVGAIYVLKIVGLLRHGKLGGAGLAAFFLAWPGVFPGIFERRQPSRQLDGRPFLRAWARMVLGLVAVVLLAVWAPVLSEPVLGLGGIAALLIAIHVGVGDVLPWLLRWAGFAVPPLFDRPWAATSLTDFWGRRWNLAFVEMNERFFLHPLYRRLGTRRARFALFLLSGALHEMGISYPAGGGWGGPFAYFALHGALVAVEKRFRIRSRVWTWFWILGPMPWLFHEPFRRTLILPFYGWLHDAITAHSAEWYLSYALYAAAFGHLMPLIAGVQLPVRLHWKEELAKLSRFNQKIFWVYPVYIVLCILAFATFSWQLHDEFLAGARAARWVAGFIAVFWTGRIAVDFAWFDSRDWPPGNALVVGHALLTSLFCSLAAVFWWTALR
jgi:alginate O-acetyltransferase complex protein AlgI